MNKLNIFILLVLPLSAVVQAKVVNIGFGSCADQKREQPIWHTITQQNPDVFIMTGDNVYIDSDQIEDFKTGYEQLAAKPGFQALKTTTPILATWDDHDYGAQDGGHEFQGKNIAKAEFLDFFSAQRGQTDDGIYESFYLGTQAQRIQIILLDTRWNRSALTKLPKATYEQLRQQKARGPYTPVQQNTATLLGEKQWRWLEQELQIPAQVRLIVSSIQLIAEYTGWESWANIPYERQRFFDVLNRTQANGVLLLSGDIHRGEFSQLEGKTGYPLWEVSASGLAVKMYPPSVNYHRVGDAYIEHHYGWFSINWEAVDPIIKLELRNLSGKTIDEQSIVLSSLTY